MLRIVTIILSLAFLAATPAQAAKKQSLDHWLIHDLVPYVRQQLTTLPRFKNESVRFVIMREESPQSEGSALALNFRDRLRDALTDSPGIRIAWRADQPGVGLASDAGGIDCDSGIANYFIGIEFEESARGELSVQVRALDVEQREWVSGFSQTWRGPLDSGQRRALRTVKADPSFRGQRQSPYEQTQTDLLAAHLAFDMGCTLLRQTAGEYVVAESPPGVDAAESDKLVELVSNNLAEFRALTISGTAGRANAGISGKAHRIDDDLYQYWITITPSDPAAGLPTLSASAYVRIPDRYADASLIPEAHFTFDDANGDILDALRMIELRDRRACFSARLRAGRTSGNRMGAIAPECYALQVTARDDAILFFLQHQLNNGLVRLSDSSCTPHTTARVARADAEARFPLPLESLGSASWAVAEDWSLDPPKDTYYVLATSDSKAARALSRHVGELPNRCGGSVRRGIEGKALRTWLDGLDAIAGHWSKSVDWQSIRVRNIY